MQCQKLTAQYKCSVAAHISDVPVYIRTDEQQWVLDYASAHLNCSRCALRVRLACSGV